MKACVISEEGIIYQFNDISVGIYSEVDQILCLVFKPKEEQSNQSNTWNSNELFSSFLYDYNREIVNLQL